MSWYISLILTCQEQVKSSLQLLGGSESEKNKSFAPLCFNFYICFRIAAQTSKS